MAYSLKIYAPDFNTELTTLFYGQDIYDFRYLSEINKPGGADFTINVRNAKATTTNLTMFNKIIIERDGVGVFIGYIENILATVNTVKVVCIGMLGFFNKRIVSTSYSTTAQDALYNILANTNSNGNTGIINGFTNISRDITDVQFSRSTVLSAWQKLANLANGELEINTNKELNFLSRLGTDKSDSITLQYIITQINSANLREFNAEVQGKDMANKVIGVRNGGSTVTDSDTISANRFGLLEKSVNFSQTNSAADLSNEVASYLDRHKIEFYAPKVTINEKKIDISTLNLGDTVKVKLDNGFMSVDLNERIIKREVKVSDNLTEQLSLGLMPETGNLLPSDFFGDIITLSNRVELLEGNL